MATVQYAHLVGPGGFSRPVAIKRLHPQFANDPGFASAFLDEARLSARIAHANVVATLDILTLPNEISVVMEYVHGESLAGLLSLAAARGSRLPYKIAVSLLVGVLHGLQAAHETCTEQGEPLGIVHRDVSPENILVGSDGVARLLDFGIAKAKGRSRTTPTGELKGKLGYMAPEQYHGKDVDRGVDVYGASVVLWEALTGRVLFEGPNDGAVVNAVMNAVVPPPSELVPGLPNELDKIVLRGLQRDRAERFDTARDMALALEREVGMATQSEVSDWLNGVAGELLQSRAAALWQLRQRAEGRPESGAADLGTRRLELGFTTDTPTRARAAEQEPLDGAARSSESGWRPRRSTRKSGWALALALVVIGIAWMAMAMREAPPTGAAPTVQGPQQEQAQVPATSRPATTSEPTPAAPPPREDEAAASDAAGAKPPSTRAEGPLAHKRAQRARATRESAPKATKASRQKSADCAQPYVVDTLGIRRWKRECL